MKSHQLFRLTQKLYGIPHLVSQQSFRTIEAYLSSRNTGMMMPMDSTEEPTEPPDDLDDISMVGVIEICGPLTYKTTGWEALCGGCSYESILDQAEDMIEEGASCIILNIDSGGGEAYGCFESSDQLRKMCDDAGVSLLAYIDGCACSAAYALACVADEVVCNPYGEVGSIGVLISLLDKSKALEQEGLKPIYISAGNNKIPFNDDNSFKPEFLADLQAKVDSLYESFCEHVSGYTGLSVEDVKATEAKVYMAKDALAKGLINNIMTNSEFVDYVVSKQQGVADV